MEKLPDAIQLFAGLVFRGIRNLVYQCDPDDVMATYTDLLIHFTPTLFPKALGDVDAFLKACRSVHCCECCASLFGPRLVPSKPEA